MKWICMKRGPSVSRKICRKFEHRSTQHSFVIGWVAAPTFFCQSHFLSLPLFIIYLNKQFALVVVTLCCYSFVVSLGLTVKSKLICCNNGNSKLARLITINFALCFDFFSVLLLHVFFCFDFFLYYFDLFLYCFRFFFFIV